jgi:hypothetical protein
VQTNRSSAKADEQFFRQTPTVVLQIFLLAEGPLVAASTIARITPVQAVSDEAEADP